MFSHITLTGPIHGVEQLKKTLAFNLRESLADRFAHQVAATDQAPVGLVDELEDVIRPVHNCNEAGR
jgi:hypothetical protein